MIRILAHTVVALAIAFSFLTPARATTVLPLFLDEIVDTAATAFQGTVLENRTERDPATGLVVTYTTFAVREVIKGTVGATHTIKQVGGTLPDGAVQFHIHGVPKFKVGEDYVVFLAGVSAAGFSSPIGLSQGRFSVTGAPGARKVANGRDFKDMTARISARVPQHAREHMQALPGASVDMDLADFKQLVRAHLGMQR
jgi:hypothetical protein